MEPLIENEQNFWNKPMFVPFQLLIKYDDYSSLDIQKQGPLIVIIDLKTYILETGIE